MKLITIFKALSNDTRLQILEWLKEPSKYFHSSLCNVEEAGVCVGLIQEKAGLSQSTISHYLAILQKAGLVKAIRSGQWTYYKRDEETISQLVQLLQRHL